ncbi:hypothetical protein [Bosea sp. MMO-172]|uniref:hypothetical protein n=1 Tax=Bosea sp. MMO-172 TaxID=3127885 RepID=UPI0030166F5F
MMPGFSSSWRVVQGTSVVRADVSLERLAQRSAAQSVSNSRRLIDRLSCIQPLNAETDTPWSQLHHCRTCAKEIVTSLEFGRSPETSGEALRVYETALIAGFDDIFFFPSADEVGAYRRTEIEDIGGIAWRHGSVIRQWWASYARLVDAWFGGRSS